MRQLGEYVKMAMKNIWANKVRTLLTMLGIIIGISSVILIISIGNGATEALTSELGSIAKGQIGFTIMDYQEKYLITEDDMEKIRQIEGVKAVWTEDYYTGTIQTRTEEFDINYMVTNPYGLNTYNYTYVKGRSYTEQEAELGKPLCVISEDDAMKLFGSTNVVGMELDVTFDAYWDMTLTICGVVESKDDTLIESGYGNQSVTIYMAPEVLATTIGWDMSNFITTFYVMREDNSDTQAICDSVIDCLETAHNCKGKNVYYYESFDDIMATINSAINLVTAFVAFVASISLLVGGIGVMNIMLVSVTERTREIGIRKALGAKTGSITVQFLAESAFITLIGGLIGILLGVGGAWVIAKVIGMMVPTMKFAPALSLGTILIASLFSSGVGLFFGIYPARKAAKLSPIEALRQN